MASHLKGVVKSTMTIKYMKRYESTKDIIASKRFTVVAISRLFDITRKVRYELQNLKKKKKNTKTSYFTKLFNIYLYFKKILYNINGNIYLYERSLLFIGLSQNQ